jgi:uncharacterized protein YndB with AHSA1/START domain
MRFLALTFLIISAPVAAEVKSVTEYGFETSSAITINASPAQVYTALGRPARWWNKAHTYSGKAENMTIEQKAGGCFCENIPADKASIEHGRVVYAQAGKAMRLVGGLGPLQSEGVSAALTFALTPEGAGTKVVMTYVVGGYIRQGAKTLAPLVDQVLAEQLAGLKRYAEGK